ncbi:MAG: hypothetical protein ABI832_14005 [bacterium]
MAARMQVVEGSAAVGILADPAYDVVPYHDRVAALAQRLGLDFSDILYLLDHLPLALRDKPHAEQRADVARLMVERRPNMTKVLPGLVARHLQGLARPGALNLLDDGVKPLVEAVIAELVDADLRSTTANLVSRVFSQAMGVAQRRAMNAELAGLRRQLALAHPGEAGLRQGSRLALVVLGRDALIGTLSRSLHAHLVALNGQVLASLTMPEIPTHTGVPYIDRELQADPGQVARCQLRSMEGRPADERQRFFGAGPHVCLGRPLSMDLFQQCSAFLATLTTRIAIDSFQLRKDDVFALPAHFTVTVSP